MALTREDKSTSVFALLGIFAVIQPKFLSGMAKAEKEKAKATKQAQKQENHHQADTYRSIAKQPNQSRRINQPR